MDYLAVAKTLAPSVIAAIKLRYKEKIDEQQIQQAITNLYTKAISLRKVKTLLHWEDPVDINDFFVPPSIQLKNKRVKFDNINSLPIKSNIGIIGLPGQGKSTLLRYLASKIAEDSDQLPIFIELRKIKTNSSIKSFCLRTIKDFGFELTIKQFEGLISSGKIIIFLDGFDEIEDRQKELFSHEIDSLNTAFPQLQIIITSRPNSQLDFISSLTILQLNKLNKEDIYACIHKLYSDEAEKEELITQCQESNLFESELIQTPLMVILLIITHKKLPQLPKKLSVFYELLFDALLTRHDHYKIGYTRERKSNLHDLAFRQNFDALSYHIYKLALVGPGQKELLESVEQSKTVTGNGFDAADFIVDIKKITGLLIEEGGKFHFPHKTIGEFFSASYVKNRPHDLKKKFYMAAAEDAIQNNGNSGIWAPVLQFLKDIDFEEYSSYYNLPQIKHLLGIPIHNPLPKKLPRITNDFIQKLLSTVRIITSTSTNSSLRIAFGGYHLSCYPTLYQDELTNFSKKLISEHDANFETLKSQPSLRFFHPRHLKNSEISKMARQAFLKTHKHLFITGKKIEEHQNAMNTILHSSDKYDV